ncbi:ATP-dependent Clp protease adapter ClpS [uncultured Georgenia sp.]|uniref:ATP-dependent Clp protease adapter ClpS n=1 Tax=uncultured Georgenia sp. TaxID=378209 RepID=UPI002608B1A5|nr:ATP-dependent Clp protease adapter ClpS [uncultured Georgenia sp.]HLV05328.1 ATP-dependent Clp protease adapter ClpS [Actinomycetaceae bacterium]
MVATKPRPVTTPVEHREAETRSARPWRTIVWNDPVNLMSYVTYVFRTYFGYSEERARRLMLQVHHEGHAVVAEGPRETMEVHVQAMHSYGLWATLAPEGDG